VSTGSSGSTAAAPTAAGLVHEIEVQPGLLRQLALGVARPFGRQHTLDRQHGEPAVAGGAAQLLEAEALGLERSQQLQPRLARALVSGFVEQALGREVDRHGRMVTRRAPAPSGRRRNFEG
jgi:hypothetical protein